MCESVFLVNIVEGEWWMACKWVWAVVSGLEFRNILKFISL